MAEPAEDKLSTLDYLISEAEARRNEQLVLVGTLLMSDEHTGKALDRLDKIEALLDQMRAQRDTDCSSSFGDISPKDQAAPIRAADVTTGPSSTR